MGIFKKFRGRAPIYIPGHVPPAELKLACRVRPITPDQEILEPCEFTAMLDIMVKDTRTGKIVFAKSKKAESFLKNFMYLLYGRFNSNFALYGPVDSTNNQLVYLCNQYLLRSTAAIGLTTNGIVVGTGNTAPAITDYILASQIAHGTGSGQLQYSAMTYGAPASDASISQCTLTRDFANASGASITVKEIGLFVIAQVVYGTNMSVLILRDTTGDIGVGNGQTLTINYRPQVSI